MNIEKTPYYVFDTDELRERVTAIREMLKGTASVCYAIKANSFVTKVLEDCVDKYELCSPGEYYIYEDLEMPGDAMVYSGVYKDKETLFRALEHYHENGIFTVESKRHFALLREWVKAEEKPVQVYLRLTSGNQFGMDEEAVREIVRDRAEYPLIRIEGIHYFSGTQKRKLEKIAKELAYLDQFCMELTEYQFRVKNLEYGPGAAISYFPSDRHVLTMEETVDGMRELVEKMQFGGHVTLEMGRFLAAMCGCYVTTICDIKQNAGENYCIVDGGIHQMNYDGQLKGMYLPYMKLMKKEEDGTYREEKMVFDTDNEQTAKWNICGALCTGNDVICRAAPLGDVKIGDVLVFERVGAYSITEGMLHFLSRNLPEVFFNSEKEGMVSVRKPIESYRMNRPQI